MYCCDFYNFTETIYSLENTNRNNQQYQGYLKTENIFTPENNPLSQKLFEIPQTNKPVSINIKDNLMLGKRVETFFKIQIETEDSHHIVLENKQIQKEKRTIGELDFILKNNATSQLRHIEISYKFYLFDPEIKGNEINKWIGPNRNDNLLKKIEKLSQRQFPLLYSKEAKKQLELDTTKIKQEVLFKAQLFLPYIFPGQEFKSINQKAICGTYISLKEFSKSIFKNQLFLIPEKQDWLISPKENKTWYTYDQILNKLTETIQLKKAPLIWTKSKNGDIQSLFITWW